MDTGLDRDKQEALGEEEGCEIKKVGKSVWNGIDAAANQFSEDAKDGMDWLGQKLGVDYDRPNENGKTYREIREEEKQELAKEQKQLEEESPYKDIFNEVKDDFYKGLNIAALVMAVRDLPALAKVGFGAIKDLNMALKSLGFDAKFIDEGIYFIENNSKKVAGKLSQEVEKLREELKRIFGNKTSYVKSTEKLDEIRRLLPDKFQKIDSAGQKIGNIAYSNSTIDGYEIGEMKSFSRYGNPTKNGEIKDVEGWVSSLPEEQRAYSGDVLKINSDNEVDLVNGYLRKNDTEYKIIENYNSILKGDYTAKGKIEIVSEREVCLSCDNVIKAFSKDYNKIEIDIIDGAGKKYIVKGGEVVD